MKGTIIAPAMQSVEMKSPEKLTRESNLVQRLVKRFPTYKPYRGFYDLRYYNMPIKVFKKLWKIQDALYEMNENRGYYKKWHPRQWQEAQLLSADYQQILFQYKRLNQGG